MGYALACRVGHRAGALWLVVSSLVFYALWRLSFLPLLLASIAFNYGIGWLIGRLADRPALQSAVFLSGISGDLLALFYYKYAGALAASLGFATVAGTPTEDIILPLGISFFTFTQIGYLVDVKQGLAKADGLLNYVLFVTFFPHLIAGPILHNREMMSQFADPAVFRISARDLSVGGTIFVIGLAKKTLLADPLSPQVATHFAASLTAGTLDSWYGVTAYSMQLYFDFSGYSDMAIGLARMFGIRFPENFNSPYKSTTVIEYWQRWHITLTRFITMYIYSPLALQVARYRAARDLDGSPTALGGFVWVAVGPTLLTMALAGIWHGAGLQYVIFGLLHGVYISINHAVRVFAPARSEAATPRWPVRALTTIWKMLAVYVAVMVGFVFFRAESTAAAVEILAGMIGLHGAAHCPIGGYNTVRLAALFAIVWFAPNTQQIMSGFEPTLGRPVAMPFRWLIWTPNPYWMVASGGLAVAAMLGIGQTTEFLYFQF